MRTLIFSSYEDGELYSVASIDDDTKQYALLDDTYATDICNKYFEYMDNYEDDKFYSKVKQLGFNRVIICDDGGIIVKEL